MQVGTSASVGFGPFSASVSTEVSTSSTSASSYSRSSNWQNTNGWSSQQSESATVSNSRSRDFRRDISSNVEINEVHFLTFC